MTNLQMFKMNFYYTNITSVRTKFKLVSQRLNKVHQISYFVVVKLMLRYIFLALNNMCLKAYNEYAIKTM